MVAGQLSDAELHEAVGALVLAAHVLSVQHSVTLTDVGVMFLAGITSGQQFLERGVH
mgnify:CR=1 FL=1